MSLLLTPNSENRNHYTYVQCYAAIAGGVRKASFYKICLMKKLDFSSELLTARDCKKIPGKPMLI